MEEKCSAWPWVIHSTEMGLEVLAIAARCSPRWYPGTLGLGPALGCGVPPGYRPPSRAPGFWKHPEALLRARLRPGLLLAHLSSTFPEKLAWPLVPGERPSDRYRHEQLLGKKPPLLVFWMIPAPFTSGGRTLNKYWRSLPTERAWGCAGSSTPGCRVAPSTWEQHPPGAGCCSHSRRVSLEDLGQFWASSPILCDPEGSAWPRGSHSHPLWQRWQELFLQGHAASISFL